MIETTIPEIDVSDLMDRVRGKVDHGRETLPPSHLPPIGQVRQLATVIPSKPPAQKTEQILETLQRARQAITVSRWIPKPLRGLFRRQHKFNHEVLRVLEWFGNTNAQLADRLRHVMACVEVEDHGVQHLAELRRADGEWMTEMARVTSHQAAWIQSTQRILVSVAKYRSNLAAAKATFAEQTARSRREIESRLVTLAGDSADLTSRTASLEQTMMEANERLNAFVQRENEIRRQFGEINEQIAQSHGLREQLASLEQRNAELEAVMRGLREQLASLEQRNAELETLSRGLPEKLVSLEDGSADLAVRIDEVDRRVADENQNSGRIGDQLKSLDQRIGDVAEHLSTVVRHNEHLTMQTNNVYSQHSTLTKDFTRLRAEFENAAAHLRHLQVQADRLEGLSQNPAAHVPAPVDSAPWDAFRRDIELLDQRLTSDSAFIKAELSRHSELVHRMISRAPGRGSAKDKGEANDESTKAATHRLDAFYFGFENRFRGPRLEIKRRQGFYLPVLEDCFKGSRDFPIVDLGCGRGEWLELLREQKFRATGVDQNATMIDQCKERGLKIVQSDAIEFLRSLPADRQGAITGFHIIEHLPFDSLVELITEAYRVLRPGGVVIFESPNCKTLTVGACYFYIDPTHRHPVFPETAQFMLETSGFERVRLEYLSPAETTGVEGVVQEDPELRKLLFGPRDFGVIGYKPEKR